MIKLLKVSVVVAASMLFACADETVRPDIDQLRIDLDRLEAQTTEISHKTDQVARDAEALRPGTLVAREGMVLSP